MGRSFLCCRFVLFTSQILGFQLVKTRLLDLRKLAFPLKHFSRGDGKGYPTHKPIPSSHRRRVGASVRKDAGICWQYACCPAFSFWEYFIDSWGRVVFRKPVFACVIPRGSEIKRFPRSFYSRTRGNVSRHQNYYKLRQFVPFYSHARGNVRFCPVGVRSYSALSMYSSRPPPGCGGLFCIRSSSAMV